MQNVFNSEVRVRTVTNRMRQVEAMLLLREVRERRGLARHGRPCDSQARASPWADPLPTALDARPSQLLWGAWGAVRRFY